MSTIGRSWASAAIVLPCPPWPTKSVARGISSPVRDVAVHLHAGRDQQVGRVDDADRW